MSRVTVRINQSAAGLGDVGQVVEADDTDMVWALSSTGVVTILDAEGDSQSGEKRKPPDVSSSDTEPDDTDSDEGEA